MSAVFKIIEFCHILRGLGVRVSTSEILDCAEVLLQHNWMDRQQIQSAFQATLIKRAEDAAIFHEAFNTYFSVKEKGQDSESSQEIQQQNVDKVNTALTFQGKELQIPEELKQVYQRMTAIDRQRLDKFLEKTSDGHNVETKFLPILEKTMIGSLEYWRRQLREKEETTFPVHLSGDARVDEIVTATARQLQSDLQVLLQKDMKNIDDKDVPLMRKLIKKMAQKLSNQISRRYHRANVAKILDLRRTIRHNMRYGGIMLQVKYKAGSKSKPKILLLCDVSGSMARYAIFVLQFTYGLANHINQMESFIFAEDIECITKKLRKKQIFADSMSEIMAQSVQWGKGTDLARSLSVLSSTYSKTLHPSTVVMIVSDTKTINSEAAARELAALSKRVRQIIWLNTLPTKEWPRHKTTELFQKNALMVPCNTLADLGKILQSQVFGLTS